MGYLRSGLKQRIAALAVVGALGASSVAFINLDKRVIQPSKTLPPEQSTVEEKKSVQVAKDMGDTVVTETVTQTTTVTTVSVLREEIEESGDTEELGYEEVELDSEEEEAVEPSYEARGVLEITFDPPERNETAEKVVSVTKEYTEAPVEQEAVTTTTTAAPELPADVDAVNADEVTENEPSQEAVTTTTAATTAEAVTTTTAAPVTTTTTPAPVTTTTPAPVVTTTQAPVVTTTAAVTTTAKPVVTTTTTTTKAPAKDNGNTPESRLNNAVLAPDYCLTGDDDKLVRTYVNKITNSTMTNYQKAVAVYDYLINNTYYAYGGWSEPYKSVLVNGFGTCTEYSRVLTAMLRYMGFNARTVDGYTAMAAGGYGYHMWTEVIINGQVYVMDANVDDDMSWGTYISHARFCKTYAEVVGNYIKN